MSTQFRKKLANLKLGELVGMPLRAFFISSFRYVILYILYMLYMLYTGQTRLQRPRYSVSSQTASFPPLRELSCCTWPLLAQVEEWGGSASPPSFRLVVLRDTAPCGPLPDGAWAPCMLLVIFSPEFESIAVTFSANAEAAPEEK